MNNLVEIVQLPVIAERLQEVKATVTKRVEAAASLPCSEENVKEIKKVRAELTKEYDALEEKRKTIKKKILEPYENFENVYKDCAGNIYKSGIAELKQKIDIIEDGLKLDKAAKVKEYFDKCKTETGVDFLRFEDMDINITLSASIGALKLKVVEYIEEVHKQLELIKNEPYRAQILNRFTQCLNMTQAITEVNSLMQAEKPTQEITQAPVLTNAEEVKQMTFTVRGTLTELKRLKEFLVTNHYEFGGAK